MLTGSADTYLDLKVVFNEVSQFLGVVGLDGVPVGYAAGSSRNQILWESQIFLPASGIRSFRWCQA